jgi:CheY-like chemotaxis protein
MGLGVTGESRIGTVPTTRGFRGGDAPRGTPDPGEAKGCDMTSSDLASFQLGHNNEVGILDVWVAPSRRRSRPWRILLIDDRPDLRQCITTILEDAGHVVEEAESGDVGVQTLHVSPIDLVITDLQMPGLSGRDVARAVRSIRPGLPVIVMTGCPELLESETDTTALFAGVLKKPFRAETLLRLIAKLEGAKNIEHALPSK